MRGGTSKSGWSSWADEMESSINQRPPFSHSLGAEDNRNTRYGLAMAAKKDDDNVEMLRLELQYLRSKVAALHAPSSSTPDLGRPISQGSKVAALHAPSSSTPDLGRPISQGTVARLLSPVDRGFKQGLREMGPEAKEGGEAPLEVEPLACSMSPLKLLAAGEQQQMEEEDDIQGDGKKCFVTGGLRAAEDNRKDGLAMAAKKNDAPSSSTPDLGRPISQDLRGMGPEAMEGGEAPLEVVPLSCSMSPLKLLAAGEQQMEEEDDIQGDTKNKKNFLVTGGLRALGTANAQNFSKSLALGEKPADSSADEGQVLAKNGSRCEVCPASFSEVVSGSGTATMLNAKRGATFANVGNVGKAGNGNTAVATPTAEGSVPNPLDNNQPAWAGGLKPNGNLGSFRMQYVKPDEKSEQVRIPRSLGREGAALWNSCMVGYFLDKKLPFSLVKNIAQHHWGQAGLVETMATESGFFIFKFATPQDRDIILEAGPWHFAGKPIFLKPWEVDLKLQKDKVTKLPVWVKLYNIPWEYWTEMGLSVVSSRVGRPLAVDKMTATRKRLNFARVCVELDATVTPLSSFELVTFEDNELVEGMGPDSYSIRVEYQWLPDHCRVCKCFGHSCSKADENKTEAKQNLSWVQTKRKGKEKVVNDPPLKTSHTSNVEDIPGCSGTTSHTVDAPLICSSPEIAINAEQVLEHTEVAPASLARNVADEEMDSRVDVLAPLQRCVDENISSPSHFAVLHGVEALEEEMVVEGGLDPLVSLTPRQRKRLKKKERRAMLSEPSNPPG